MQTDEINTFNDDITMEANNLVKYLIDVYIYKYPTADFKNKKFELLVGSLERTFTPQQLEILRCPCQSEENLELRKKVIDIVAERLIFSDHFLSTGYYRSKRFLEEFNAFYSLGITNESIESRIENHHKKRVRERAI